jgi:uncharacterized protein (DUF362 family)/Pyruvate/2-oxoacid:ferredoxin oxidoreductase delta subunit
MNKAKVSIVKADDYDYPMVYAGVEKCLELLGGLGAMVKPESRIFVKINHLSPPSPPERGIVTHPIFVQAVLEVLKCITANITVGDDIDSGTVDGFQVSGIRQVCQKAGVRLVNLKEGGFVETRCSGLRLDTVYLSKIVLDADVIINLPKLKTHSLTLFTGGIKNMYGCIPKGHRTRFHYEYTRSEDFCQVLTDIFSAIRPHLTIMDGIVAMEGEGPGSGSPRRLGIILASRDTVALDAVATRVIGLEPMSVLTTRYSHERGLGNGDLENIKVVGEKIEDIAVPDFELPDSRERELIRNVPNFLSRFLLDQMSVRPKVVKRLCTGCLECEQVCPATAVSEVGEKARIDESICIRCMCCHEVCRLDAIIPRRPIVGQLLSFASSVLRRLMATSRRLWVRRRLLRKSH